MIGEAHFLPTAVHDAPSGSCFFTLLTFHEASEDYLGSRQKTLVQDVFHLSMYLYIFQILFNAWLLSNKILDMDWKWRYSSPLPMTRSRLGTKQILVIVRQTELAPIQSPPHLYRCFGKSSRTPFGRIQLGVCHTGGFNALPIKFPCQTCYNKSPCFRAWKHSWSCNIHTIFCSLSIAEIWIQGKH